MDKIIEVHYVSALGVYPEPLEIMISCVVSAAAIKRTIELTENFFPTALSVDFVTILLHPDAVITVIMYM